MLTVAVSILMAMMAFSAFIVIMACIAAARSSSWEEQYWHELFLFESEKDMAIQAGLIAEEKIVEDKAQEIEQVTEEPDASEVELPASGEQDEKIVVAPHLPRAVTPGLETRPSSA